jgi:hypothetical protein
MEFPVDLTGKALVSAIRTKYPGMTISEILDASRIHEAQRIYTNIRVQNFSSSIQILVRIHDWNLNLEDYTKVVRLISIDEENPHHNYMSKLIDSELLPSLYDFTRPVPEPEKRTRCGCFQRP